MSDFSVEQLKAALVGFELTSINYRLRDTNINQWQQEGSHIQLLIQFGFPIGAFSDVIVQEVTQHLSKLYIGYEFSVQVTTLIKRHAVQPGLQSKLQVRNVIAVMSGKGGVGKSTVCALLARCLSQLGAKVGLVDADIYGPSIPHLLNSVESKPKIDQKRLFPIMVDGIQTISMGHLVDSDSAMIWRGPMATQALSQLVNDTQWEDLDYLFVDMPPGTGDIPLSLAQKVPVSGCVVITTPQDLALLDVKRAISMLTKLNISVLGIIENMATFECPHCHELSTPFGQTGVEKLSEQTGKELLGKLPLSMGLQDPNVNITPYLVLALKVVERLSLKPTALAQVNLGQIKVES